MNFSFLTYTIYIKLKHLRNKMAKKEKRKEKKREHEKAQELN